MSDEGDGWVTLEEFVNNNPLIRDFMLEIERQLVIRETRRIVEVTTRKYRARRGRRRR